MDRPRLPHLLTFFVRTASRRISVRLDVKWQGQAGRSVAHGTSRIARIGTNPNTNHAAGLGSDTEGSGVQCVRVRRRQLTEV